MRIEAGNDDHIARSYNNIGICFKGTNQYDSALFYYSLALDYAKKADAVQVKASVFDNLANIYNLLGDDSRAIEFHLKSLQLREGKETFGFIAANNNLSALYNKTGDHLRALFHANRSDSVRKKAGILAHAVETYKNKADAFLRLQHLDSAQKYYDLWGAMKDSAYGEQSIKAVAEMQTKYETEKKEQELKILKAESQLQTLRLRQGRELMISIVILAILAIAASLLYNSRKRYKLKARLAEEKEKLQKIRFKAVIDAEEKERKRIARELHDGLGQLLSTARLTVSALDDEDPKIQNSLKLIDMAVDEVRNISHNMMPNALISYGLKKALEELVRKINETEKLNVCMSNDVKLQLDDSKSVAVYRVVQEVFNNIIKYAEAKEIEFKLSTENGKLVISIKDDGKGFDSTAISESSGIGWSNVYSRMEMIGAQVSIFSGVNQGTTVKLTIPLDQTRKSIAS